MERYFLFGGQHYYPFGGVSDFIASVDAESTDDARNQFDFTGIEWWQIAGLVDGKLKIYASGVVGWEAPD